MSPKQKSETVVKNIANGINQHVPRRALIDENSELSIIVGTATMHFAADGAFIGSESRGP